MRKGLCAILAAIFVLTMSAGALQASEAGSEKPVRGIRAYPRMFGTDRAKAIPLMEKTLDAYVRAGIDTVIMEEGVVDMLCPMICTNDAALFDDYGRRAVAIGKSRTQVCLGIGFGTSHNRNTPEGMLDEMRISRERGADGVIYFSADSLIGLFLDGLQAGE